MTNGPVFPFGSWTKSQTPKLIHLHAPCGQRGCASQSTFDLRASNLNKKHREPPPVAETLRFGSGRQLLLFVKTDNSSSAVSKRISLGLGEMDGWRDQPCWYNTAHMRCFCWKTKPKPRSTVSFGTWECALTVSGAILVQFGSAGRISVIFHSKFDFVTYSTDILDICLDVRRMRP